MGVQVALNDRYTKSSFWIAADRCTMMCWFYGLSLATAQFDYDSILSCGALSGSVGFSWRIGGTAGAVAEWTLSTSSADTQATTPLPVVNRWYHLAVTRSGNTKIGYVDGRAIVMASSAITMGTTLGLGDSGGGSDAADAYLSGVKIWRTALSERDIRDEMRQHAPVRTGGIAGVYRFLRAAGGTQDLSGRGQTLTAAGSPVTAPDPPGIPWIWKSRARVFVADVVSPDTGEWLFQQSRVSGPRIHQIGY